MPDPTPRFDPSAFGPAVAAVLGDGRRLAVLDRGTPDERFRAAIQALDVPPAARAGLWLYHDFWDEAHEVAQDINTPDSNFWHAVLHRREPDPFNSNYWWRRVGRHPVLDELGRDAADLGYGDGGRFDPERFVGQCEQLRGTGTADEELLRRVQLREWQLLLDHCRGTTG